MISVSSFFPGYFLFITSGRAISSSFIFLLPYYLLFAISPFPFTSSLEDLKKPVSILSLQE